MGSVISSSCWALRGTKHHIGMEGENERLPKPGDYSELATHYYKAQRRTKHIHYLCHCTDPNVLEWHITRRIYSIPYSLHWILWQTGHTFRVWSKLSCWIWQTVQAIDFTREAWWEISTGAIRDQGSSHCWTFIGSLNVWDFLCFFPCSDCSILYEKSMKDFRADCETSIITEHFWAHDLNEHFNKD